LQRKKICFVATVEWPLKMFLREQILALSERYDVVAVANTRNPRFLERTGILIRVETLKIERDIAPLADIVSLVRLILLFSRERFSAVHSINPKSGLIAMLAAYLTRVPVRVHTFTGQVWVTRKGPMRWLLRNLDRFVASLATHVVTDSHSQLTFLREQDVLSPRKGFVPRSGSVGGVDIARFAYNANVRETVRQVLGIPEAGLVFLFVGRMNQDKGLDELARAFFDVAMAHGHAHLLLVGPDEKGTKAKIQAACGRILDKVHFIEYTDVPEHYMSASDVLCLPSHREGFGTVVIEAAAAGLPAIGSRIYGLTDAIVDGETGFLHEVGDSHGLAEMMAWFVHNPSGVRSMGSAACERAGREFSQESLTAAMLEFYAEILDGTEAP
jgi:glycosyltransferase involved in cell wall biosynthesis